MKRRIATALAIAALLVAGIAGALGSTAPALAGPPMDEVEFDLAPTPSEPASATVTSGLEIISGNAVPDPAPSNDESTAGFCTRCGGTEVSI